MPSQSCKITLTTATTLVALAVILTVDAQHFIHPRSGNDRVHYIGRRWSTSMKFTYSVPNINEIESVACGHERGPHTVLKMGTRPAILMADPRQAELYGEVTGSYIYIGFKNLMESKPAFDCRLVYSGLIYFSGQITFKVYDPIKVINCLNSGKSPRNRFELVEGGKLTSTCIAGGIPIPFIQCSLLNRLNWIGQISRKAQRNFTTSNPIVFNGVHRRVVRIQCVLTDANIVNRREFIYGKVVVYYRASAPEKIMAIRMNYTSIMFNWTAPRDTGRSKIISYRLKILQLNGTMNEQSKILIIAKNTLLEYAFYGLQNGTFYRISVSAFNEAGEGGVRKAIFKTPHPLLNAKVSGSGKSVTNFIGIGAGGLVAVIALFGIVFFVMKKRQAATANPRRDAEKAGGNAPGSSAMPSNLKNQPVADSPGGATAVKSKEKAKENKNEKEKKEKERKEKEKKEKEMKEKEKKEKEKKENEKKEKEKQEKEKKEKEKKEKEKQEKEKKEKEKKEKERKKKKAKEKAEKPADPPRATVFGRTVKQPEDKDGKGKKSAQPPPQPGGKGKANQSNDAKKQASKR